ncbi:MAG: hypothetical protein NZV14_09825 [Bryobacteraceae bacterium]|nr:hypothetical protein [Bryobacteraceae bacterium]MDW8378449.1 hypothetical protein [Bryobacterales bacterium]
MKPLVWVHEDCLRQEAPYWNQHREAPAVFVFDDEQLEQEEWTLKRIAFLYECLLELPVEILRGDTVEQLRLAQQAYGCDCIVTADTPEPRIRRVIEALRQHTRVEVAPEEPFVELDDRVDLRRFARYWKQAQLKLFPQ